MGRTDSHRSLLLFDQVRSDISDQPTMAQDVVEEQQVSSISSTIKTEPKQPLFFDGSSDEDDRPQPSKPKITARTTKSSGGLATAPTSRADRTPSPSLAVSTRKRGRSPNVRGSSPTSSGIIDISDSPIAPVKSSASRTNPKLELKEELDDDIVMMSGDGFSSPSNAEAGPSRPQVPSSSDATLISIRLSSFVMGYIGEYYTTGYSLNKGKGYITNDAKIHIERNKSQAERDQEKAAKLGKVGKDVGGVHVGSKTTIIKNGKVVRAGGSASNGKQATLVSMGISGKKAAAASSSKKPAFKPNPADNIIRFRNDRGFEVGRIPTKDAEFLAPLLDADIIHLDGYVIECPPVLTTGCDITLCLRVYLKKEAFIGTSVMVGKGKERSETGNFWQQQGETEQERKMRLRKDALGLLFGMSQKLASSRARATAVQFTKLSTPYFPQIESPFDHFVRARW